MLVASPTFPLSRPYVDTRMSLLTAALYGAAASSALIVGSVAGAYWGPDQRWVAGALALSSGALITALAFELFDPAYRIGGATIASVGLLVGAATFTAVDWVLDEYYSGGETGPALLASVTLDGVPENVALGIVLVGGGGGGLAVLVAIFLSNLPEALGGTKSMADDGYSNLEAIGIWAVAALLLAGAVVAGNTVFARFGEGVLAAARAFAGGAVLASIADEILPQAYESGGPLVAVATAVGFVVTFLLRG